MSDFSNVIEVEGVFASVELDDGVDFFPSGDYDTIISSIGWDDGGYGDGPYGGEETIIIDYPDTIWTDIETP